MSLTHRDTHIVTLARTNTVGEQGELGIFKQESASSAKKARNWGQF